MVYVEVVVLILVNVDFQVRDLVLYATSQNKVICREDLELFPLLIVLLLSALHGDVWIVFIILVEDKVVGVTEHGHGVASSIVDFIIVVLKVVLGKIIVVVAARSQWVEAQPHGIQTYSWFFDLDFPLLVSFFSACASSRSSFASSSWSLASCDMRSNSSSSNWYFSGKGAAKPRGTQVVAVIIDMLLYVRGATHQHLRGGSFST